MVKTAFFKVTFYCVLVKGGTNKIFKKLYGILESDKHYEEK